MERSFYQVPFNGEDRVVIPQTVEPNSAPLSESEEHGSRKTAFFNPETKKFFGRLGVDDVILLAVILLLATDTETDVVLLVILGFLLLNGLE